LQDIRWKALWLLVSWLFVCLIIAAFTSSATALLVFSIGLLAYQAAHLYWIERLHRWLNQPDINTIPLGQGIWEDVFAKLYHEQRRHLRTQVQLSNALDRFRHAAGALPDGVVLLNDDNKIEWCNKPAELHLGISLKQDVQQPIVYLLRSQNFHQYLQHHTDMDPIKLNAISAGQEITLETRLVSFGSNQKLLLTRDISQIEKLDLMRRDFIANVSHELRTPLTVVGGFLETLNEMDAVNPSSRPYFDMMIEQTHRMRLLIEDLLTLSQLEVSNAASDEEDVDMDNLLQMVLAEAKGLSQGKHEIELQCEQGLHLRASRKELHSALSNLVSNAIRYTPEGGEILIAWQLHNREAVFSVKDSGIGIEPQHISRLTERFYRVDRSRSRETGGTGLGLSIVKHILSRHQGRLEITSELGKGSTFKAVFPQSRIVSSTSKQ
jgi:two-component system phosphate regulon sensor histidine kinase PhoR